jgi:15-cis-phytoene synthase
MAESGESPVVEAARAGEPDRYLAALLARPEQRDALIALAAFAAELGRIPQRVASEPAMAEIRLQWWRDAFALPQPLRTGYPVADAVRDAALRHNLPHELLSAVVDGRELGLRKGAPLQNGELDDLLWGTEGALFAVGAHIVGLDLDPRVEGACAAAGRAYGLSRLLLELPRALVQGRVPLAAAQLEAAGVRAEELLAGTADGRMAKLLDICAAQARHSLAQVRPFAAGLPRPQRVVFLPLALVGAYLRAVGRQGWAPASEPAGIVPLTRVCRIAAAHLFGRL